MNFVKKEQMIKSEANKTFDQRNVTDQGKRFQNSNSIRNFK